MAALRDELYMQMRSLHSRYEQTSKLFTKRKQKIWDEQYLRHHKHLEDRKGRYEAGFIIEEILGPRPETPLLDDIATEEQLKQLEDQREKTDDILSDWRTPPGSPWERNEDTTFDSSSPILGHRRHRTEGRRRRSRCLGRGGGDS